MTIYERLDDDTRQRLNAKKPVVHRPNKRNNEQLSERDLQELMGTKRDRYHRVGGKVKRK